MRKSEDRQRLASERKARREAILKGSELVRENTIPLSQTLEALAELHKDCGDPIGGVMFLRLALRAATLEKKA